MNHKWSRSWNFLNKLIKEFLPSIFRSEALFGHPVPMIEIEGAKHTSKFDQLQIYTNFFKK